eukprot:UN29604
MIIYLAWLFEKNYKMNNHSETNLGEIYAHSILDNLAKNSIVLLNGDLNNNLPKYYQQCENVRPDVHLIGIQQMSWPWFVKMQRRNYRLNKKNKVVFPGNRYHPFEKGGFTINKFIQSNFKKPIYLCGEWKHGDESYKTGNIQTEKWGICQRLFTKTNYEWTHIDMLNSAKKFTQDQKTGWLE